MKRFSVLLIMLFSLSLLCAAEFPKELFNKNISEAELTLLEKNQYVIRKISTMKKISFCAENEGAVKLIETAEKLKPAYIAEIIQILPVKDNPDLRTEIKNRLMDISSYAGIPYYSQRMNKWYDLYEKAEILETKQNGYLTEVLADLTMEPFGVINTKIITEETSDYFYYSSTNLNTLRYYDKFTCVNPQKMKSQICVFRYGDNWILYAIGAVNAPNIFFIRERVETSFINRINTFCSSFFKK